MGKHVFVTCALKADRQTHHSEPGSFLISPIAKLFRTSTLTTDLSQETPLLRGFLNVGQMAAHGLAQKVMAEISNGLTAVSNPLPV